MPEADNQQVRVEAVTWQQHQQTLASIRRQVFVEEQHVPEEDEWDAADADAVHFLAITLQGEPVGCARLLPAGKIGRMAVLSPYRQRGIGTALLREVIEYSRTRDHTELYLDAQLHALDFYRRLGFVAEGEPFQDAGIPHRRMRLSIISDRPADDSVVRLSGPTSVLDAMRVSLEHGRHSVDVLSDRLTPVLYSDEQLVSCLSALARNHRRARVRILVKDTRPLRGAAHRLVDLSHRLPSRVMIRALRELPQEPAGSFLLVDKCALVQLASESEFTGFARAQARAEGKRLLEQFDHLWEHYGASDPNLKSFVL